MRITVREQLLRAHAANVRELLDGERRVLIASNASVDEYLRSRNLQLDQRVEDLTPPDRGAFPVGDRILRPSAYLEGRERDQEPPPWLNTLPREEGA